MTEDTETGPDTRGTLETTETPDPTAATSAIPARPDARNTGHPYRRWITLGGVAIVVIVAGVLAFNAFRNSARVDEYERDLRPSLAEASDANASIIETIEEFDAGELSFGETQDQLRAAAGDVRNARKEIRKVLPIDDLTNAQDDFSDGLVTLADAADAYADHLDAKTSASASWDTYQDSVKLEREILGSVQPYTRDLLKEGKADVERANLRGDDYEQLEQEWANALREFRSVLGDKDISIPSGLEEFDFDVYEVDEQGEFI